MVAGSSRPPLRSISSAPIVAFGWGGAALRCRSAPGFFLFDDEAELVCGASGRSLLKLVLDSSALPDELVPAPVAIPTSVLALAHAQPDHAPVEGMVRLVQAVVSRTSVEKGVHALYKMLLLRDADDLGLHNYRPRMTSMAGIEQVMRSIMDSEEYARLPLGSRFASPFHSADATEPLLALAESEVGPSPTPGEADDPGEVISLRDLVMADRENWRQVEDSQLRLGSRSRVHVGRTERETTGRRRRVDGQNSRRPAGVTLMVGVDAQKLAAS